MAIKTRSAVRVFPPDNSDFVGYTPVLISFPGAAVAPVDDGTELVAPITISEPRTFHVAEAVGTSITLAWVTPAGASASATVVTGSDMDPAIVRISGSAVTLGRPALAADPALASQYSPQAKAHRAARFLALQRDWYDPSQLAVAADTPTVTCPIRAGWGNSTPGTAPITNGVFRAIRRTTAGFPNSTAAPVDVDNDTTFEFIGRPTMTYGTSTDAYVARPALLTGGSSQSARWSPIVRFQHTGTVCALQFKAILTSLTYRLRVNGKYVTAALQTVSSLTAGSLYDLVLTFTGSGTRDIEIECTEQDWGGVWCGPTDTVGRPPKPRATLGGFGDSITAGASPVARQDTWLRYAADNLGARYVNLAIGGTGYVTGAGTNAFNDRLADITQSSPDVLVIFGGYNDAASYSATVGASSLTFLTNVQTALPTTPIIVVGPWLASYTYDANLATTNTAIRASCSTLGIPFIDLTTPLGATTAFTTWVSGTFYGAGDCVLYSNQVYLCVWPTGGGTQTTAPSSAPTIWQRVSFTTGTGKVGATTGVGNADVVISSDGIHPTALGHQALGAWLTAEITRALRTIATA